MQDLADAAAYPEQLQLQQQLQPPAAGEQQQQPCADLQTLVVSRQLSSLDRALALMRGHQ